VEPDSRQPADRYVSGEYAAQNPDWGVKDSPWKTEQILEMLHKHRLQPATIVDVGCGAGEVLRLLHAAIPTARCAGYDVSPMAIQTARKAECAGLRFYCEGFFESTGRYDLALCIDVLEHVPDYLGFLEMLRGRGEHVVFHIPLDLSAQMVFRGSPLMRVRELVGHLHYFTEETALASLRDAGFIVLDTAYTAAHVGSHYPSLKMRLARWPRRVAFRAWPGWTVRVLGGYSLLVLAQ
jgi:cyclopropane fatty-acyl-phospholipid synthase-like methyltransferase